MKKLIIILLSISSIITGTHAQEENLFTWNGKNVIEKSQFMPLFSSDNTLPPSVPQYVLKEFTLHTPDNQDTYSLKLIRFDNCDYGETTIPYDKFILSHNGNILIDCIPESMQTVARQTMNKSNAYYLQIPLEDNAFALLLGGWYYGYGEAPETIIVIVKEGTAKIVFDNYAYAYKYQAPPDFSMEFVDDVTWNEDHYELSGDYQVPSAAALKTRTKHKIWREGNMLKYKNWK